MTLQDAATRLSTALKENIDLLNANTGTGTKFRFVSPYGNISPTPGEVAAIIVRASSAVYDTNSMGYQHIQVVQNIDVFGLYIASDAERRGQNVEQSYVLYTNLRQYLLENRKLAIEADGDNPLTKYESLLQSDSGVGVVTWPNAGTPFVGTTFNLQVRYTIRIDYV